MQDIGLDENTPLFYFLLKEAEIIARGRTLGPIGSYIIGAVIEGALEADPSSYVSVMGPNWRLPLLRFPNGSVEQVNSMIRIVRLVGDNQLLPECEARWKRFLPLNAMSSKNAESGGRRRS